MRILGIDPGVATVGIGLIEAKSSTSITLLDYCCIETAPAMPFAERLLEIQKDLEGILTEFSPDLVVIEKLYFSVNEKTALDVAQARGVLLSTVAGHHLPLLEPTPPQLKSCITGDGSADKRQMQEMVQILLKLNHIPKPDDAADALALALFGAFQGRGAQVIV